MNRKFARLSSAVLLTMMLAFAAGVSAASADGEPISDNGVEPVFVAGNPSCTSLGYAFGFKVDPPNGGTYNIDGVNTVTVTTDGTYFDWSSTLGMDAVLAKGGPNANSYVYDPPAESFGDGGLASPINPSNGEPFGLSHIEFCYDYELTASKTANATYTRTYTWTIDKSVDDDAHEGFTGDSFTSNYDVVVDQTVTDSDFAVSGTITVNNPTPFTVGFSVSDSVGGTNATVNCPTNSLSPGGSTVCTYSASLASKTNGTNTATITSNNSNVNGTTASADYTFGDPTTTVGPATINVTDTLGGNLGSASGDRTFTYSITFTCDEDEGTTNNTATIVETGQEDSESVTVTCHALTVTKTANTSLTRTWTWTIDKSADADTLLLSEGQLHTVNYQVQVSAASTDSNHVVSGTISVDNSTPIDASLSSVSDVVSGGINASVDCGVSFPHTLEAGDTLNCTYSADLPDGANRINTATATIQNTPSGTTSFSGTANVDFSNATVSQVDDCVDVSDTNVGVLGTVCAFDAPKTFTYSLNFGAHPDADVQLECGDNTHINTASFVTNDSGTTGSDDWTVNANVACAQGCTLTQGYWKTHSDRGPAPYDDAWKNLGPLEEDTLFFKSGKTWYQVFWTSPAGNAFYNLAHQYMAAKLNILNGASAPQSVTDAIAAAEALFNAQGVNDTTLSKAEQKTALSLASTLDKYNNGLIGPGHCSE
jgi:hypothetical protein